MLLCFKVHRFKDVYGLDQIGGGCGSHVKLWILWCYYCWVTLISRVI